MRLYVVWIIIGLLTIIIISNLFIIYDIIKVFIFIQNKINLSTISTTTQTYTNSVRSGRIDDATVDNPVTLKHRHRYEFNKALEKYIRLKKPGEEQISSANSIVDSTSNFYITNQVTTADNNTGSSVIANISNINATTDESFRWNIFVPSVSDTFIAASLSAPTTTIRITTTTKATRPIITRIATRTTTRTTTRTATTTTITTVSTTTAAATPPLLPSLPTITMTTTPTLTAVTTTTTRTTTTTTTTTPTTTSTITTLTAVTTTTTRTTTTTTTPTTTLTTTTTPPPPPRTTTATRPHIVTSQKFLKISSEEQTESEEMRSLSPIEITVHPPITILQTMRQSHREEASSEQLLDPLKEVKFFKLTTTVPLRVRRSEFTLVTALLDIGRGDWWEYRRPMEVYYGFLENLLKLKVNLVIFVDKKSVRHVYTRRKLYHLEHITKVIPTTLTELPLYRYMKAATEVIADERSGKRWDQRWDRSMSSHPEAKSPKYDILVNSKSYFLYNASLSNPFKSEFFAWLDAGYAHGNQSIFPPSFHWHPTLVRRKISLIKVTPFYDNIMRYTLDDLYRKNWAVISGGFLGGDIYALNRFHQLCHQMVIDLIYRKYVDDDQTTLVLLIQRYPSLFNVVHGDWFDAFNLFP